MPGGRPTSSEVPLVAGGLFEDDCIGRVLRLKRNSFDAAWTSVPAR